MRGFDLYAALDALAEIGDPAGTQNTSVYGLPPGDRSVDTQSPRLPQIEPIPRYRDFTYLFGREGERLKVPSYKRTWPLYLLPEESMNATPPVTTDIPAERWRELTLEDPSPFQKLLMLLGL